MRTELPQFPTYESCCAPGDAPLSATEAERLAAALKALADPTRLRLISLIGASGEACVCDLTPGLDLTQPTISHHLKVLHDAGLVTREQRGVWAYYRVVPQVLKALSAALSPT